MPSWGFHMCGCCMRIIAGTNKGARLFAPKNNKIRPTSDRVREFIFSYLGDLVSEAYVLDLFAGTGALGFEARSRGAGDVTFVDNSLEALEIIQKNSQKLGLACKTVKQNVVTFLKHTQQSNFDLIFCDPPYNYVQFDEILSLVVDLQLLALSGFFIYECSARQPSPLAPGLGITKEKVMGDTKITFYKLL